MYNTQGAIRVGWHDHSVRWPESLRAALTPQSITVGVVQGLIALAISLFPAAIGVALGLPIWSLVLLAVSVALLVFAWLISITRGDKTGREKGVKEVTAAPATVLRSTRPEPKRKPRLVANPESPLLRVVAANVRRQMEEAVKAATRASSPPTRLSHEQIADRLATELKAGYAYRDKARMASGKGLLAACRGFTAWAVSSEKLVRDGATEYAADFQEASRAPWALMGKAEVLKAMDTRLRVQSEIVQKLRSRGR